MQLFLYGVIAGCLSPIVFLWAIRAIRQAPGAVTDYVRAVKSLLTQTIKSS